MKATVPMGMRCELDVDECITTDIGENGATCNNEFGSYNCNHTCVDGYEGDNCEIDSMNVVIIHAQMANA